MSRPDREFGNSIVCGQCGSATTVVDTRATSVFGTIPAIRRRKKVFEL